MVISPENMKDVGCLAQKICGFDLMPVYSRFIVYKIPQAWPAKRRAWRQTLKPCMHMYYLSQVNQTI